MLVWLASYPRSGNTFFRIYLREIFGIESYSVYKEAIGQTRLVRSTGDDESDDRPSRLVPYDWQRFADYPEFHVVKTHHPPFNDRRAIYIVRDGHSSIASYYHYIRDVERREASMESVIAGLEPFGSWSDHVEAWDPLRRPNTLLLRFEQLVRDPVGHIPAIAEFLGRSPVGNTVPTFEELHKRAPKYFRAGRTDSSRPEFSPGDLALLEALHGDVLTQYGYPLHSDGSHQPGSALRSLIRDIERKRGELHALATRQGEELRRYESQLTDKSSGAGLADPVPPIKRAS